VVTITFRIYEAASGGTALWTEVQDVTVNRGLYSVRLGESTALNLAFDVPYYLGVKVGADAEMIPRLELGSVGYAFRAKTVESVGSHTHSGADIATGIISEARIDPLIARGSEITSAISNHTANDSAHHVRYTNAEAVAAILAADGAGSGLNADLLDGQHASAFAASSHDHSALYYTKAEVNALVSDLQAQIAALQSLLQGLTRSGGDFIFTNANLYIQSGSGATNGVVNGKGNLIIGYNELRESGNVRTGSHNLIVGTRHNFSSYGGMVIGYSNTISGYYSSVSGGTSNTANGMHSSVSGGLSNNASGEYSAVSGGANNNASFYYSSVSGGNFNTASASASSVSGGYGNTASGYASSVSGGYENIAFSYFTAILGGRENISGDPALSGHELGEYSTVSGGANNIASGFYSSVSGGHGNTASGEYSAVSGGETGIASEFCTSISGGWQNTASAGHSSILGGRQNQTSGGSATVSGGANNIANGLYSSVGGGEGRSVTGQSDWRGGSCYFCDN
jgi:hypothetical protein